MFHSVCHCYMCTWAITPVFTRRFKIKIKEDVVISILVLPLNFFTFFIFWKLPIVFSFVESFFFIMTFLVISVNYNGTHYERSMYLVSTKLLHVIIIMSEDDMFPFTCIRNVSILHRVEQECLITRKKILFWIQQSTSTTQVRHRKPQIYFYWGFNVWDEEIMLVHARLEFWYVTDLLESHEFRIVSPSSIFSE